MTARALRTMVCFLGRLKVVVQADRGVARTDEISPPLIIGWCVRDSIAQYVQKVRCYRLDKPFS